MGKKSGFILNISNSGFVRSVITRGLAILIVASTIIASVAFLSFTAEIRRSILGDRQKQLATVEKTISDRMDEIHSIAYNIGNDSAFYLEPVAHAAQSVSDMTGALARYLVGNNFIMHLAYCRAAEPDIIYTPKGSRSLSEFLSFSMGIGKAESKQIVNGIHSDPHETIRVAGSGDNAFFTYGYPLPQLSSKPQAHVLMMIPVKEVRTLLETLFINGSGEAAVYDAGGGRIYGTGNLNDTLDLTPFVAGNATEQEFSSASGQKYVLQKIKSESTGWTFVSVIRYGDTFSGLANKQIAFIFVILFLLVAAIILMLVSIVRQFQPISNLAAQMAGAEKGDDKPAFVDERKVLPDTIAVLKDDSEQKQKYETAYYEAQAASQAKSAFLSSMSHDIRTPMNAIIGMTAIARKHISDQAYVDDCLKKVQDASDYLLDIINNVLDMSRIEAGRIPIAEEPLLLPALIDSVVSLMTSDIEAKSQTLSVDVGGITQSAVLGDGIHIVQVFVNILSNAIKFTPEGGKLSIKAYQTPSGDKRYGDYVFDFSDTGIGIAPEFIAHVFDTFTRGGEAITSRTEGAGLGMAIAKKLIELMNGTIACESELGHGTTFTVKMHMKLADRQQASSLDLGAGRMDAARSGGEDAALNLTGKRILLVEDNAMNREIARRIIAETGAQIVEANDGKQAVDIFARRPAGYFDLIFMDIQMPVMNGYEATAAIRLMARPDAATVPIYAMTANTFDEDVRQVKDAGMNGHIGKPYNPQTLYRILARVIG